MTAKNNLTLQQHLANAKMAHDYSQANEIIPADEKRTSMLAQAVKEWEKKVAVEEAKK